MRKSDLVERVMDAADLPQRQSDAAVSAIFEQITNALSRGDSVALVGFGSFLVKTRAARSGRNPQTGESLDIPSSLYPSFKPGKGLRDAVNRVE